MARSTVSSALNDVVDGGFSLLPEEDVWALVAWNLLAIPGDRVVGELVSTLGAAESWAHVSRLRARGHLLSLAREVGCDPRDLDHLISRYPTFPDRHRVDGVIEQTAKQGIGLYHPQSPSWPQGVDDLGLHRPLVLWGRGRPTGQGESSGPAVAVVGSRRSTEMGRSLAVQIAQWVTQTAGTVISGGARGIDYAAHRTALHNRTGHIAVLASSHDDPYPPEHWALFDRIAHSGWVLSETPVGRGIGPSSFLHRNRLIASLAEVVVVVEANWRSGALNTASHAQTLGRRLIVPVDARGRAMSAGTRRLLDEWGADGLHIPSTCGVSIPHDTDEPERKMSGLRE